jgi:thioredoxin 1
MPASFAQVRSVELLDRLFTESHERPVVIFKHSTTCGISSGVRRRVEQISASINLVVVQTHRDISNAIAARTGIRHESPQAIVLLNGEPVYHASHYDIDAGQIEARLIADAT